MQAWFQADTGQLRTYEFRERRHTWRRGLFIQTDVGEVELRVERVSADAWDCGSMERTGQRVRGLRLVAVRGTTRQVLLGSPLEEEGNPLSYVSDELLVRGIFGPFVSVERRADYFAVCSPHTFARRTFHWFDLRDGRELDRDKFGRLAVELPAGCEMQLANAEQELLESYRAALVESGSDLEEWFRVAGPYFVEGIAPRLHDDHWEARVHVALPVPYAWSNGQSVYQIDTHFDVPRLADWLPAPLAQLPPSVTRFARRHSNLRLLGGLASEQ